MLSCTKFLHSKDTRQSLLSLKSGVSNADGSENMGVLGTWIFDQEVIRNKLSEMVTIDELPFKFIEGGFQKVYVCVLP